MDAFKKDTSTLHFSDFSATMMTWAERFCDKVSVIWLLFLHNFNKDDRNEWTNEFIVTIATKLGFSQDWSIKKHPINAEQQLKWFCYLPAFQIKHQLYNIDQTRLKWNRTHIQAGRNCIRFLLLKLLCQRSLMLDM